MKYTVPDALFALNPEAEWTCLGNTYSGINWLDKSHTKPTESEVTDKVAALDAAEPMRLLREERNKRLAETDWRASSDLTINTDWKDYRKALRDLPASSTPKLDSEGYLDFSSVTWPTKP
tara:strand:- start:2084 stop:2443 length:360 start_codon:yes stop_codon:yes gene_type:complete